MAVYIRQKSDVMKKGLVALALCAVCILLNLLLGTIVGSFGLPLYLDTVGSILAGILGGYLPGVIVGFCTNIAKSISDPASLYYGVLNVLIAIVAAFFGKRKWHKKPGGIICMIVLLALIGGGLGTAIPLLIDAIPFESESLSVMLHNTGFFSAMTAHVLSGIIMDLPDKAVSVFLAFLIAFLIPKKYRSCFALKGWMKTPLSEEEISAVDRTKTRIVSLKVKILLVLGIALLTISAVVMFISMRIHSKNILQEQTRSAQGAAVIAASVIDGDLVDQFLESRGSGEAYAETRERLNGILQGVNGVSGLHVYKMQEDGCHVIFDIKVGIEFSEAPGTILPYDENLKDTIPVFLAGKTAEPVMGQKDGEPMLTAFWPVTNSEGENVCYAAVDVNMDKLSDMRRSFMGEVLSVYLGFFIFFAILVAWLAEYHMIFPVNTITRSIEKTSFDDETQEKLYDEVKQFRSISVHTGDEIEKLYEALCRLTLDQAEQIRSIRQLSESTANMQEGLIVTMADMVENRDSDTGAHIQKTAAYVRIIVEGLRRDGYYAEKVTSRFISDVVRSAPLHDVGKINIPDSVLNKPGKLTPEEFEIMKTHTTAGKQILDKAIGSVEDGSYLREARNMAAYHHERWDGKGYPEGLHGEEIPLSARIMSVADVFDALTSPRVYKPPFSFEKALDIIKEGRGTQFDPRCVDVFMNSLPEVQEVRRRYAPEEQGEPNQTESEWAES